MDEIGVINLEQIKNILADRIVTYARVVVDFRPQKEDPNRVRIAAGGNLIAYPDKLTTRTADLTMSKILWNSVLSTDDAQYATLDIANFYLGTPLDRYEYMKIPLSIFPQHTKDQYDLNNMAYQGCVWLEIRKTIYGLEQAGILAYICKLLREKLAPHGYYEVNYKYPWIVAPRDTPGTILISRG